MSDNLAMTPFGSRSVSLGVLALQRASNNLESGKSADKWQIYRNLCEARSVFGVGDRTLAVLSALLSFYPDSLLEEGENLIVFPSNKQLSLRAHGMAGPTLRRHLSALVQSGLILRRDSPNGKRYAHKGRDGEIEEAFGFSLAPLLLRVDEIMQAAEEIRAYNSALRRTRERLTLQRRDISKLIEVALEEGLPGSWSEIWSEFRTLVEALPRKASLEILQDFLSQMNDIREKIDNTLKINENCNKMNANDVQNEHHYTNSNSESLLEFETALEKKKAEKPKLNNFTQIANPIQAYSLAMVLKACPDIEEYAVNGISNWRDLMATTAQMRGFLGISPSAYEEALDCFGQEVTAIIIACILQRTQHIQSAGGYLRALTEKAYNGKFSAGPMLIALLNNNMAYDKKAG